VLPRVDDLALSRERVQEGDERGASRIRCTLLHERPGHQLAHPRPVAASWAGTVRVKLELTFLWFAANPHDLAYPARAWATLLGLPDPAGRGARRINEAILWLEQR